MSQGYDGTDGIPRRIAVIGNVNADTVVRVPGYLKAGCEYKGEWLGTFLGGSGANAGAPLLLLGACSLLAIRRKR